MTRYNNKRKFHCETKRKWWNEINPKYSQTRIMKESKAPNREICENQKEQSKIFSYYFLRAGPLSPSPRRFREIFGGAQWATFCDFAISSNFWNSYWLKVLSKSKAIGRAIAASLKIFSAASSTFSNAVLRLNFGKAPYWCGVRWSTIVSPLVPNSWSSCRDSGRNPPMLALIWKFNLGILTGEPRNSNRTNRLWHLRKKHGSSFRLVDVQRPISGAVGLWSPEADNSKIEECQSWGPKRLNFGYLLDLCKKEVPPLDSL